jgi:type IV pilus assembly protein PilY1
VLLLNLRTQALETGFGAEGVLDLGEANAFVGDIVAADHDLDVNTDALYFGTTQSIDTMDRAGDPGADGITDEWRGQLYRLRVQPGANAAAHDWKADVMFNPQLPMPTRPSISFDHQLNRWLHVGTGRFFTSRDSIDDTTNALFGLKEPRNTDGEFAMDTYSASVPAISLASLVDVTDAEVTEYSGDLNGSVSVTGLTDDTVSGLEQRLTGYQVSTDYLPGWRRELRPGERAMGAAIVLGGVVSQSTYLPQLIPCSFMGDSFLYALRHVTGTAGARHVFYDPDLAVENDTVIDHVRLGGSPSLTPAVQLSAEGRKDGEATLINMNADMSITTTEEQNLQGLDRRETAWREM